MKTRGAFSVWLASILLILSGLGTIGCDDEGNGCHESLCGPPIITAGEDQTVFVGTSVTLTGEARLPPEDEEICMVEKNTLTFEWEQTGGTDVVLADADKLVASFTPSQIGEYRFRFRAIYPASEMNCTEDVSQWDEVTVTVDALCGPPVAAAGSDQQIAIPPPMPVMFALDGTSSHTDHQRGCELSLIRYTWTVVSEPAGAQVTIANSDQAQASVPLTVLGTYELQLEVQDDGGTVNRTDIDTDVVQVEVLRGCVASMIVTAIDAETRSPLAGANVSVTHASGGSETQTTDASGEATFDLQNTLPPRSITVVSDETVPSISGLGPDRQKYEYTTVLEYPGCEITIPLHMTGSGEADKPTGTVVGKIPANIFTMLPHSYKCLGSCQTDNDCHSTYYCELHVGSSCYQQCTPRSLLPFFGLGDPTMSGQFRFAMLVPVLPDSSFTYRDLDKIFARTTGLFNMWPGNLVTDDTFLSPLGPLFGREEWGVPCVRTEDCPNTIDYVCEEDLVQGEYRCKDKSPMRNIRVDVPAGQDVKLVLVTGIMDVSMMEFLPVFLPMMMGDGDLPSAAAMLQAFRPHTLHVCLFSADVAEGIDTDISGVLAGLDASQCWSVDCTFTEGPVPMVIPGVQPQACLTDMDCCSDPGHCGWPDSRMMCLPDPSNPASTYCYQPLFRVQVVTNDEFIVEPDLTAFDPTGINADTRLCSQVPADAPFEVLCPTGRPGIYQSCDPRDIRDMQVPANTECSFPYGISLAAIDFPAGHPDLPEGGRVFIGFDFNRGTTHNRPDGSFLVPVGVLDGTTKLSATQMHFRNLMRIDSGTFLQMPGYLTAQARSTSTVAALQLSALTSVPALDVPPGDAGFAVRVVFETDDPTVFPPLLTRTFALAEEPLVPQAGSHDMTYSLAETTITGESLKGVLLGKVDYDQAVTWVDSWWRVYMPAGTKNITLPAGESPFASGDYVWITPFGAGFGVAFDYVLFPTDVLLGPLSQYSEDSWAVIVP